MNNLVTFCLVSLLYHIQFSQSKLTTPPLPISPTPSYSQLKWQRREIIMFFHFGMNTFTDSEWGTGEESPSLFNPTNLDTNQWMEAAVEAGVSLVILVAKHHDGFCLWPTQYTDHSVKWSPWREGKGDVLKDFVDAARAHGIDAGLYLSPWDRHERTYGREVAYNEYYLAQLHEILTRYGSVQEIWFDGAKGKNATNMTYHFQEWFQTVKQLQPSINIFSDAGPDIRWVGDEAGSAGSTCWSTVNRTHLKIGDASLEKYLNTGDPHGTDWVPPECDVSIRPGWFWHKNETAKSMSQLLDIYYKSVGRNCVLLINVPPNSTGLVSESDITRMKEFHQAIQTIFSIDMAKGSETKASSQRGGTTGGFGASNVIDGNEDTYWAPKQRDGGHGQGYWIELCRADVNTPFNVVRIQEAIQMGQRIKQYEVFVDGIVMVNGTTVGHKRLHQLKWPVFGRVIRVWIKESRGPPLLSSVGLHFDPFRKG
ncbi:Alpha-L-fucosidase 1 [Rhynchospora pubera]|uniref:alpha-L-fucosidase n=1 Tax=Rhynchospora pubera TaxID=906938 RepID=A0AAV8E3B7_9POAL|nr:Alpha-L-fucosidase 1 [Rhynchospora pubera]